MKDKKKESEEMIQLGAEYVEEYLRISRGKVMDADEIKEIIDIYYDYLLLIEATEG